MATLSRSYPSNLPLALSSFIGRGREIVEIKRLFSTMRLITLTGPGGCGKTRLAIWVASELGEGFKDGVWLVELAPLSDPELTPQAIATVLGVREPTGRKLVVALADFLLTRELLLVLDNCEHLVAACAQLAERLLQSCPNLKILATSREALNISGETVWTVPPLSLPESQPWHNPASGQAALPVYQASEAVRLFVERAAAASPTFTLTEQNGAWVADICRRLDGMPLAIELAAARVRALSVQQIAERLNDRFRLLTTGSRTAPPRQQTLQATLDWSYGLLFEAERLVLQRLSIFAGGCTLEAAEVVCGEDVGQLAVDGGARRSSSTARRPDVLDLLTRLVDKSLIVVDKQDGEARYRLLETIRQYAHAKLAESSEEAEIRDRHLAYCTQWAEAAEPYLNGPEQLVWLDRYEAEHDNLRAALEWCHINENKAEAGLRLTAACGRFWRLHAYTSEGRARFAVAVSRAGAQARTITRARALMFYANLMYVQSDYPAMRPIAEEALSIWRGLGKEGRAGLAYTLDLLGELATEEGDYASAPALFQEALEIYRELQDVRGVSEIVMQLGWAAIRTRDYQQAERYSQEFLALARESGDKTLLAFAYSALGEVAVRQGQYQRAVAWLEQSLALNRERGDKWGAGTVLGSLGWVALRQHDFKQMRAYLGESLTVRMEIGDRGGIAWCLEKLAEAASLRGQFQQAMRVFGAAAALRAPLKSVIDPADQPDYDRMVTSLRAKLGEEDYAVLWAEGEAMALDEAVECALSEPETPLDVASAQEAKEKYSRLTAREREVAALIAQGKSNREIAEAMTVGVKTVETYVTRILNKLGFDSRVQIATWAIEKGLRE